MISNCSIQQWYGITNKNNPHIVRRSEFFMPRRRMCDRTTNLSLGIANLDPPKFPKPSIRRMQVLELQSAAERAKLGFTSTKKGLSWKIIGISPDPLNNYFFH